MRVIWANKLAKGACFTAKQQNYTYAYFIYTFIMCLYVSKMTAHFCEFNVIFYKKYSFAYVCVWITLQQNVHTYVCTIHYLHICMYICIFHFSIQKPVSSAMIILKYFVFYKTKKKRCVYVKWLRCELFAKHKTYVHVGA